MTGKYVVRVIDKKTREPLTDEKIVELSTDELGILTVERLLAKADLEFVLQPGQTCEIQFRPMD